MGSGGRRRERSSSYGIFTPRPHFFANITCSDIMIDGERSWDMARLHHLFKPGDIAAIVNVPIREATMEDRLYWQFSDDGRYTVSSGSKAQGLRSKGDNSSSAGHINRPILNKLWKLKVPKKCIFPIWRLWHGSLAVGSKFRQCGMHVDASCSYCEGDEETKEHLFLRCPFAQTVWDSISDLHFVPGWRFSMMDLLIKVMSSCRNDLCEVFVMVIWAIWRCRNDYRFNGTFKEAKEVRNMGLNHLLWYKEAQGVYVRELFSDSGKCQKWKPLDPGSYLVNCGATFPPRSRVQGLGAVIRRCSGMFFAGHFCRRPKCRSVLLAELQALWLGLQTASDLQLREVVLQSDSATAVKLLWDGHTGKLKGDMGLAEMGTIIRQCRLLAGKFTSDSYSFIPRSGNSLAHLFAQKGLVEDDMSFYNVTPNWAKDVLDVDFLGMTAQV